MEGFSDPPRNHSSMALLATIVLCASAFCIDAAPAEGSDIITSIPLRAVVQPVAHVKILQAPATFTITEEDIRRGYPGELSSLLEIVTNSGKGCLMTLSGDGPFKETEVTMLGRTVVVGPGGGFIEVHVQGRQVLPMRYRIILVEGARPGVYPWPFRVSVEPLN